MKNTAYFLPLYVLISLPLYAAESIEKKIDIDQKSEPKFELVHQYQYETHAEQNEDCYLMRLSPDEKNMMSVGYDDRDQQHYLRIHTTDKGRNIKFDKDYNLGLETRSTIQDAAWSPDSAYIILATKDDLGHMLLVHRPRLSENHVATSYRDGAHYFYNLVSRTGENKGAITTCCHDLKTVKTVTVKGLHMTNPDDDQESWLPEQSCFLNAGKLIGVYLPVAQAFMIANNQHINDEAAPITCIPNVTAADLSGEIPVTGKKNGKIYIRNPQSGKPSKIITAFANKAVTAVALAPEYVAALSELDIRILSRSDGKRVSEYTHEEPHQPRLLRFIQAGVHAGKVVAYTAGRTLTTFDASTAKKLKTIALDGEPHSMLSGKTGLYVGTALSITRFAPKEVTDKKEPVTKKDVQDKV